MTERDEDVQGNESDFEAENRSRTMDSSIQLGELFADMFMTSMTQASDSGASEPGSLEPAKWIAMMCKMLALGMSDVLDEESAVRLARTMMAEVDAEFLPGEKEEVMDAEVESAERDALLAFNRLCSRVMLYAALRRMYFHKLTYSGMTKEEKGKEASEEVMEKFGRAFHPALHEKLGRRFFKDHGEALELMAKAFAAKQEAEAEFDEDQLTQAEGEA